MQLQPLNVLRHTSRFGIGGRVILISLLTLLLVECGGGGGGGGTPPPSNNNYGWVLIDESIVKDASVHFYGRAFSDPPASYTYNNCPNDVDLSMQLKWANKTSGTSGYGLLFYMAAYWQCEHRWQATVPLIPGKNVIVITASNSTASGSTSTDVMAPLGVSSTLPLKNATNVPVNSTISATFNGQIDPQSVTSSSFILSSPYGTQTGRLAVSGSTVTFTPDNYLYGNTTYTATITTAVKDTNGIATANYMWRFTTGPGADATPPVVSSTNPTNSATGISVNSVITATFSEPMMVSTITPTTFTLNNGVTGTVTYSGNTATFRPTSSLANSTSYTATITTGVRDAAANAMAAPYTWTFTTATAPAVISTSPINNASGVGINTVITATFNKAMDASTITPTTFSLNNGVMGTVTYNGTTAIFTPTSYLASYTTYTATITTSVQDVAGNAMALPYIWNFTTGLGTDNLPPTVSSTSPIKNATGVSVNSAITATFSEPMDASTVNTATFFLKDGIGNLVGGTIANTGSEATFTPTSNLAYSAYYTAIITTDVKDIKGNAMVAPYTWTFSIEPSNKMSDTGQTMCYDALGTVISCAGTGQDGAYIINPPSYTDNGNNTITDNVTGLIWQKQDDAIARNWSDASTYCSNLSGSWRLPSRIELLGIVDYGVSYPAINAIYFPSTKSLDYWTSSRFAVDPYTYFPLLVSFGDGNVSYSPKTNSNYVRCVQGVEATGWQIDNGNGTVSDVGTHLIWQQGESSAMAWEASLTYCEGLTLAGQTNWRLPNIKELSSLVNDRKYGPAINTTLFPSASSSYYWSSTKDIRTTSQVWSVSFLYGFPYSYDMSNSYYVRCVRGGQ